MSGDRNGAGGISRADRTVDRKAAVPSAAQRSVGWPATRGGGGRPPRSSGGRMTPESLANAGRLGAKVPRLTSELMGVEEG